MPRGPHPRLALVRWRDPHTLQVRVVEASERAPVVSETELTADRRASFLGECARDGVLVAQSEPPSLLAWAFDEQRGLVVDPGIACLCTLTDREIALFGGRRLAPGSVDAVFSFVDPREPGHYGVRLHLDDGAEVEVAAERSPFVDPDAEIDPGRDARWISSLGEALARWLGVAHRDDLRGTLVPADPERGRVEPAPGPARAAGTDALIDGLIDAFYRYDDPDRVAARAAREREVAERDARILAELRATTSGRSPGGADGADPGRAARRGPRTDPDPD